MRLRVCNNCSKLRYNKVNEDGLVPSYNGNNYSELRYNAITMIAITVLTIYGLVGK